MLLSENGRVIVSQTHGGFSSVLMCYDDKQNKGRHQADLYLMSMTVLLE